MIDPGQDWRQSFPALAHSKESLLAEQVGGAMQHYLVDEW